MKLKRAFTLIELLVVIAIIAILAAILFPVFAQAKVAAKKTVTISGMKQMTLAVLMYVNDAEDTFPMGSGACWFTPLDGGWVYDTQPYVKTLDLLRDSMDPKEKKGWPSWLPTNPNGINISFVSNGYLDWDGSGNAVLGVMGLNQAVNAKRDGCTSTAWMSRGTVTTSQVVRPSATIAFTERFGSNPAFGPSSIILDPCDKKANDKYNWDSSGWGTCIPDGSRDGNPYKFKANGADITANLDNRFGGVTAPFNGQAIFGMCDGSAKAMDPRKTNPDLLGKPSENMWNAFRAEN